MKSYSQIGQDVQVVKVFNQQRDGYFLDIGAFDGVTLSNTYLLEKEFGWKGICVEPNPESFEKLTASRSAFCSKKALFKHSGEHLEFIAHEMLSGIKDIIDCNTEIKDDETSKTIRVETISPTDLLKLANVPTVIDYMSLDTEGSELDILEAFDFTQYTIKLIHVEHNFIEPRRTHMRNLLESHGYVYYGPNRFDDVYVHKDWVSELNCNVLTPKVCIENVYMPKDPFWGFGDYLRGSLSLAEMCRDFNFKFEMNYIQHPIAEYLMNTRHTPTEKDLTKIPIFNINNSGLLIDTLNIIKSSYEDTPNCILIPITTHVWYLENGIKDETRQLIKDSIIPNSDLEECIQIAMTTYGVAAQGFHAVHCRLGDKYLVDGEKCEELYAKLSNLIQTTLPTDVPYVVFSDDAQFKSFCRAKGMCVSVAVPCHLSSSLTYEGASSKVKDTLCDFFCLSKAKAIYTFSNHGYGSGFVDWCADIFKIPTHPLKILEQPASTAT